MENGNVDYDLFSYINILDEHMFFLIKASYTTHR